MVVGGSNGSGHDGAVSTSGGTNGEGEQQESNKYADVRDVHIVSSGVIMYIHLLRRGNIGQYWDRLAEAQNMLMAKFIQDFRYTFHDIVLYLTLMYKVFVIKVRIF